MISSTAQPDPRRTIDCDRLLAPFENASVLSLLKLLPNEESSLRFLFALRGGPRFPCPACGSRTRWRQSGSDPFFRSKCCRKAIDVRAGTLFAEVRLEVRMWLYLVATFLNRTTPLSTEFVAAHLETDKHKAWRALAQVRRHIERLNAQAFDPADHRRCYLDEFLYRPVRHSHAGSRSSMWLLGMRGASRLHVEPVEARLPGAYRAAIERLGLGGAEFFSCNPSLASRLREEFVPVSRCELTMASRGSQLVQARDNLAAFWPYFVRSMRRGSVVPIRAHLPRYVADYVYRFNHASEKHLVLRRFLAGIAPL